MSRGRLSFRRVVLAALAAVVCALASACAASRDSIPESRDVRVATPEGVGPAPSAAVGPEGYLHVARRPLGVVGLADFRGIELPVAQAAAERLADKLDACATELGRAGKLANGAARLVAQVGPDGDVQGVKVTTSPGAAVTANALLCLVSPLKLLAFPAASADAGDRGLALEATWGAPP